MRCATGLGAAALAAALLVTDVSATTHALWRDETPAAGATVTSGRLDVGLALVTELAPAPLPAPGTQDTVDYRLTTTLEGDNLDGKLRLGIPAWHDVPVLDVLDVGVELRRDGALVATGTLDPQGQVLFAGSPEVPVELAAGASALDVRVVVAWPFDATDPTAGPGYTGPADLRLPDGELVADLWQVRPGDEAPDDDRLWQDTQDSFLPAFGISEEAVGAAAVAAPAPAASTEPEATLEEAPEAAPTDQAGPRPAPSGTPTTEPPTDEAPTDDVPTTETPEGNTSTGAVQAPATSEEGETAGPVTDPAVVAPDDPPWAAELLTLLADAGIDPATLDLDAPLPTSVEQWAADRAVPTTDVVAWLRERQP